MDNTQPSAPINTDDMDDEQIQALLAKLARQTGEKVLTRERTWLRETVDIMHTEADKIAPVEAWAMIVEAWVSKGTEIIARNGGDPRQFIIDMAQTLGAAVIELAYPGQDLGTPPQPLKVTTTGDASNGVGLYL